MLGPVETACRFCERPTPPEALFALDVPDVDPALRACQACRDDLRAQGRRLEPFEPRFRTALPLQWTTSLAHDARGLLRDLGAEIAGLETKASAARVLEPLRARFAPGAARPDAPTVLRALGAAIVSEQELAPWPQVERGAADLEEEAGALAGVYAHQQARVRLLRLTTEVLPLVVGAAPTSDLDPRRLAGDLWLQHEAAARVVFERDRGVWDLLEAARVAYTMALPGSPRAIVRPAQARVAVLRAVLLLERGELRPASRKGEAPAREPDALERAQDWLRACQERAAAPDAPAGLRDPRLPLLRGLVEGLRGNAAGLDTSLDEAQRALERLPAGPARDDIEACVQRDRYARLVHVQRFDEQATHALRRSCALRSDDRRLFLELAHLYLRRALPAVAREVLERRVGKRTKVDDAMVEREVHEALAGARAELERLRRGDPDDREAQLLQATCLLRLGEPREAFAALDGESLVEEVKDDEAAAGPQDPVRAESLHLAGRCAWELGREHEAGLLLLAAYVASPREDARRVRRTLVHVLLARLRDDVIAFARGETGEEPEEPWRPEEEEPTNAPQVHVPTRLLLSRLVQLLGPNAVPLREELAGGPGDSLWTYLLLELATPTERAELRQKGVPMIAEMADVGFGMNQLDRAFASSAAGCIFLACRALHARRLPEAVHHDRRARETGGPALPIELLLRGVALVKSGGENARREAMAALLALGAR